MNNVLNEDSEKLLYSKVLNISVKGLASDVRFQKLTLNMEWRTNATSQNKLLAVHLTDSSDPFFYYMANISEDDFLKMKRSQDLLVDFLGFPEMFTNLLEECIIEDAKSQPKLVLSLHVNTNSELHRTAVLDIVEKNRFKHIVHLSILLPQVSNVLQKQYITTCYRNIKGEKERLETTLLSIKQDLTKQLQNCQETNSSKVRELEDLVKNKDNELCRKEQKIKDELRRLKDDLSKKHKDEVGKLESKLRHKDNYHKNNLHEQETKVRCLEGVNKEYTDKLNEKSKMIKDLKLKLDSLQTARQEIQNRLQATEKEIEHLQNQLERKEEKIIKFSGDIYSLQLKVNEKEEVIDRLRQNLESVTQEKEHLKQQFLKLESQYAKIEELERELQKDQIKSNEIIHKYINQIKDMKAQLKVKMKTILKQDELIAKKTKNFEDLEQKLASQEKCSQKDKQEVEHMKSKFASMENKFASMEKELRECREAISMKNNIIKHLDNELIQKNIGQDPPWNGENSNKGCFPGVAKEAILPSNQVPREHYLDVRYLQRHQPIPLHNPMDEDGEPSFLQELYNYPKSDPRAPFQPFSQHVYASESTDQTTNHASLSHNENIQSGHSKS